MFPRAIAERAVAEECGIIIQDNYLQASIISTERLQLLMNAVKLHLNQAAK